MRLRYLFTLHQCDEIRQNIDIWVIFLVSKFFIMKQFIYNWAIFWAKLLLLGETFFQRFFLLDEIFGGFRRILNHQVTLFWTVCVSNTLFTRIRCPQNRILCRDSNLEPLVEMVSRYLLDMACKKIGWWYSNSVSQRCKRLLYLTCRPKKIKRNRPVQPIYLFID